VTRGFQNWRLDRKWLLPISVLAVAFVADAWKLGQKNLWLDEAASWITARQPLPSLVAETAADVHPPLYYLALKLWMAAFGESTAALRSLSLVCGVVGVLLAFRLASRFVPIAVAYVAALWYALSPLSVFYSQEARMYPAAGAAVLGACLACRRWIDSDLRDRRALTWYAVSSVIALYLHYFTVLPLVVMWLHVLLQLRGHTDARMTARRAWTRAHAVIAIAFAPWVPVLFMQVIRGQDWRQAVLWSELPHEAGLAIGALTFGAYYRAPVLSGVALRLVLVLGVGLAVTAFNAARRNERDAFLTGVGLMPLLFGLALMPLTGYLNLARYLSFCWPLIIIAAARGWTVLKLPTVATCSAFLLCILTTGPALQAYYASSVRDDDLGPVVAYLMEHPARTSPSEEESILVAPGYMTFLGEYFSRGRLDYTRIDSDRDLADALQRASDRNATTWLLVDARWPDFANIQNDARLQETRVPGETSDRIRLFRIRANP
jgi:uncharacterized membrane protein